MNHNRTARRKHVTAKLLPTKYQAACDKCGVGVDSQSEGAVVRWAVAHNINHRDDSKENQMTENNNTEATPDEHNETICAEGETMRHECRCAAADHGPTV